MQEMQETQIRSLGQEDPLKKEIATHSSILAWEISRTEEPGGLQFMALPKSWRVEEQCLHMPLRRHRLRDIPGSPNIADFLSIPRKTFSK